MLYTPDTRIELPEFTIAFGIQTHSPERIIAQARRPLSPVEVPAGTDFSSVYVQELLGKTVMKIAVRHAPDILLPRAEALAAEVGAVPQAGWRIASGRRILGTCSSRGLISLSAACVFLPQHLRDYIVWHELAHLSEMNHGPRFHAVCNRYCRGREKELVAELRRFQWPLPPRIRLK